MILHTQPAKLWTAEDFLLLEAYQILESEKCPQCGMYRWVCGNESNDIQFRLREDYCSAKAKVDRRNAEDAKKTGYTPPPGTVLRPEPYVVIKGKQLADYRRPYYKAELKKHEEMQKSLGDS